MIVELIGCAGAGKSTLARMICAHGLAGRRVQRMPELLLDRPLLRRVAHPTAVNVVQELGSFPFFVGGWPREREFFAHAWGLLMRNGRSSFDKANGMRGIVRKLGMYELARRRARDVVVLSDEGTLLSAYNLLVMTDLDFGESEVDTFLRLVPRPDCVVHVRAPLPELVERATTRPTPRRQHRGRTIADIESDIRRTVQLFDLVAASPIVADRTLVIENGRNVAGAPFDLAHEVARWLEGALAVGGQAPAPSIDVLRPGAAR